VGLAIGVRGNFLEKPVPLYNCGPARLISNPDETQLDVLHPRSNRIRLIRVNDESRERQNVDVVLPWERRVGAAAAIAISGSANIAIVRGDGAVFEMDVATQRFTHTLEHADLPNRIPPAAWPTSPDGSTIYLGYNQNYIHSYDDRFYLEYGRSSNLRPEDATAGEFRVFDTRTWRKIATIKTKTPFWSATIGKDGKTLYAMAPQKHGILVIDTATMHQIGVLKVGEAPTLALVAP
jgi:hypothetical protein